MVDSIWIQFKDILKDLQIPFEEGLSDTEIERIQNQFCFTFPPDLRDFLQAGLPVGDKFPDWRSESADSLRERLNMPLEGILFDVEFNGFWLAEWGSRPAQLEDAKAIVKSLVAAAPVLIPIYAHRMIADRPSWVGNPVFSVHQTDIIYYGVDLRDYLIHEFLVRQDVSVWPISDTVRQIDFWNIERLFSVRWANGPVLFDNRRGILP